jgi:hypothetical protein
MTSGWQPLPFPPLSDPTEHLQRCAFGGAPTNSSNWWVAGRVFRCTWTCTIPRQTAKRWGMAWAAYQRTLIPPRASALMVCVCVRPCTSLPHSSPLPSARRPSGSAGRRPKRKEGIPLPSGDSGYRISFSACSNWLD